MLSPRGRLAFDAEGLSDAAIERVGAEEPLADLTLETLVRMALQPELLKGEDDLAKDLDALRAQLQRCLLLVDEVRRMLSGPPRS